MQNTQDPYRSFKFPAPRDTSVKGKNFNPMMVSGFRPSCRCSFRIAAWAAELLRLFEQCLCKCLYILYQDQGTTKRNHSCTLVQAQKHGVRNASVRVTLRLRQDGHSHPSILGRHLIPFNRHIRHIHRGVDDSGLVGVQVLSTLWHSLTTTTTTPRWVILLDLLAVTDVWRANDGEALTGTLGMRLICHWEIPNRLE